MKVTTRYSSDYEYKASTEDGRIVNIDMKPEGKLHLSPMELVLSALSGCIAVEIALMVPKRRKTVHDLIIEAEGTRKEENPRGFTDIKLKFLLISPDATVEELEKITALSLEKYCSVADSLQPEISIECEVKRS
ncbi:OsmC family protein [Fulvivirga sp. M361]|uniref:OsmC family protein n=1 Tax=Fulvivirga sp. M361 TaxID=2594266 RepID=UPI00117ADD48|nr:OsmC family protein [Fulvivirga sp. M361]TRX55982.1 OsmC family protein [Fulvivirga sp. M361]